jgi:hypothetical protein
MPISRPHETAAGVDGFATVNQATGEITIVTDGGAFPPAVLFDPADPLGWVSAATVALARAGWSVRHVAWVPSYDGPGVHVRRVRAAQTSAAPAPLSGELADMHREYVERHSDGASSNDVAQWVDEYFTERGFPAVLYA